MFEDEETQMAVAGRALVDHKPPNVSERLREQKKELELRLEAINQLIEKLDANPDTKDIIDRLSELGHRMY